MKKFSIKITSDLEIYYNHYLSTDFIKNNHHKDIDFKEDYPSRYVSRIFDKPAIKWIDGTYFWNLDNEQHRVGKPSVILHDGGVGYHENGKRIR